MIFKVAPKYQKLLMVLEKDNLSPILKDLIKVKQLILDQVFHFIFFFFFFFNKNLFRNIKNFNKSNNSDEANKNLIIINVINFIIIIIINFIRILSTNL